MTPAVRIALGSGLAWLRVFAVAAKISDRATNLT